ncbi:AraC family transcriptional regulator [Paenibacillus contaminans]|uniref:Transcriptional regulator n=1 Tax=Paenibacillus contaminans TaxID=450362 RepID=A0A329MX05_9BACL|nr:AraC family transcriptional regulator [Paenibacillus contaminans]RAV23286.1 transcriptional regulator [Paenibacillus contaminans]
MRSITENANVFDIMSLELLTLSGEWRYDGNNAKNEHLILFVTEGKGIMQSPSYSGVWGEGNLFVFPSPAEALTVTSLTEPSGMYMLRFASANVRRTEGGWLAKDVPPPVKGKLAVQPLSVVRQRFEELNDCWSNTEENEISLQLCWLKLLTTILKGTGEKEPCLKDVVHGILNHLDEHFDEDIQIEEIARFSGVSPSLFYQHFKEHTSLSPRQYVTKKRMEQARRRLVEDETSIRDVAVEIGYNDVYYFNRMFKKTVGIPPFRYQKSFRRKIAVLSPALFGDLLALGMSRQWLIPCWNPGEQKPNYRQTDADGFELGRLRRIGPEMIIGTDLHGPLLEKLNAIAPTRLITFKPASWRGHLLELGIVLDVKEVAEQWLHYYDLKAAAAGERIGQRLQQQTILAAKVHERGIRVFGRNRRKLGSLLYGDLQLNAPESALGFDIADIDDLEQLNDFKADHLLLVHEPGQRPIRSSALKGTVHRAGIFPWLHYSAFGQEQAIDNALVLFSS